MGSMFSRIYLLLLGTLIVVGGSVYVAVDSISQARFTRYAQQLTEAPMALVREGWLRQPESRREEWMGLMAPLTGVEWQVEPADIGRRGDYINADWRTRAADVERAVDAQSQLVGTVSDWNQLIVGTGYLLLNELARVSASQRPERLLMLSADLPYDVAPIALSDTSVGFLGQRQLRQGQAYVQAEAGPLADNFVAVYVPMGDGNVLRLGPVQSFSWLTPFGLASGSAVTLSALGLLVLLILHPLRRRLRRVMRAVDAVTDTRDSVQVPTMPADELGKMGEHINQMAERLINLVQRNQELNRAVSHDLKTPLARIRFALELLQLRPDQQETAAEITWALDDLEGLISELLFYHSIGAEREVSEALDCQTLPALAEQVVQGSGESGRVSLQVDSPPAGALPLSSAQCRRVLNNLLSNALRYGHDRVSINIQWVDRACCISVSDDGDGIPGPARGQIFEPFYRLDAARNLNARGHGLGLAICQSIVSSVNGRIDIIDSSLGGACFSVWVPVRTDIDTAVAEPEAV